MKSLQKLLMALVFVFICLISNSQEIIQIPSQSGTITITNGKISTPTEKKVEIYNAITLAKALSNQPKKYELKEGIKLLNTINWYGSSIPLSPIDSFINYDSIKTNNISLINSIIDTSKKTKIKSLIVEIDTIEKNHTKIKNLSDNLKSIKNIPKVEEKIEAFSKSQKIILLDLLKNPEIFESSTNDKGDTISTIDTSKLQDFFNSFKTTISNSLSNDFILKSYEIQLQNLTNELELKKRELVKEVGSLSPSDLAFIYDLPIENSSISMYNYFENSEKNISNSEILIKLSEQSSLSPFSFKMPSQAEMIDAVAIYLSKRVKQELTLWFFDEIRNNAEHFPLIEKAFPESINLLSKLETYETPNLGSAWKYALAKDFIKMPENLLDPTVIKNKKFKETHKYLKAGMEIFQLINQNYSYRDIITQLYLNNTDTTVSSQIKETITQKKDAISISDILTLLYAVNNELFLIEESGEAVKLTHLDYNFLRTLSSKEIEITFKLINSKYGDVLNKFFPDISKKVNHEKAIKWLGGIGMSLEQFSTVIKDYQKLVEERRNGNAKVMDFVYEAPSVFKLTIGMFKSLIPNSKVVAAEDKFKKAEESIKYLEQLLEVYELYSNKNYAGGTIKVVGMVNQLLEIDSSIYQNSIPIKMKELENKILAANKSLEELNKKHKTLEEEVKQKSNEIKNKIANSKGEAKQDSIEIQNKIKNLEEEKKSFTIEINNFKQSLNYFELKNIDSIIKKNKLSIPIKEEIESAKKIYSIKLKDKVENSSALSHITKLGSFLNDVALSNNSKDLAKVVESYAMPPGTYKMKRNAWFSIDLNAYVGPYVAFEKVVNIPDSLSSSNSAKVGSYGLTAPIGLTFSFNSKKNSKNSNGYELEKYRYNKNLSLQEKSNCTFYFTTSIIDLGAIVAFRFTNSNDLDMETQKFKWAQFFSPGFSFGMGIPKTPLVAQIGYQYAPQIRRVSLVKEQFNAHRISLGILVDIPLFNMWTKRYSSIKNLKTDKK